MPWTATRGGCLDPGRRIAEEGFLSAEDFHEEGGVMPRILGCVHLGEVTARVQRSV